MNFSKVLELAKNEFVYGGHLLSSGVVGIVITTALMLSIKVSWDFLVIVYLTFYVIYAYDRLRGVKIDMVTNHKRTEHVIKSARYLPTIIFCSVLMILFLLASFGNVYSLVLGVFILFNGFFYTEYLKKITRKIIGFKSFYVSFIWALLPIYLAVYYNFVLSESFVLVFLFVFLRCVANAIFFDIKDFESDRTKGLKTVVIVLGKKRALFLLHFINLISFIPLISGVSQGLFPSFSLVLIIFYFYSFSYLFLADKTNINIQKLSYVMVDGEFFFWPVSVLFYKWLIFF